MIVGVVLAFLTSCFWALGNLCIQRSGQRVGTPRAMLWALGTGGALSALCAFIFDQRTQPFDGRTALWLALGGVAGVAAYVTLFFALARARLTIAVPLVSSWSLWATVLAVTVLGEPLRAAQVGGGAVIFMGVVLVGFGASRGAAQDATGTQSRAALLASFASSMCFALMIVALAQLQGALGAFGSSAAVYGIGIALLLPFARWRRTSLAVPPAAVWPLLVLTGSVETAGFVAITVARLYAPTAVVGPVASLSSALTLVFGWVVLRERPHPVAAVGAVLASVGLVLIGL